MRVALTEFHKAGQDKSRPRRAWTLFLLLPRLFLFCPARGGLLPKGQLQERFNLFTHGERLLLLTESRDNTKRAMQSQRRRRRTQQDTVERRVERAEASFHLGQLSSGRQALEGAALAPDNEQTRRALTDATRRSPTARAPLSEDLLFHRPAVPLLLSHILLLRNLRCAKRPVRHDSRTSTSSLGGDQGLRGVLNNVPGIRT